MLSQKLVQRDGELSDALTGRVIYGVRNGCRSAGYTDLSYSSGAIGRLLVGHVQEQNFNVRNIAVNGNVIFRKRGIHDSASTLIKQGFLGQRHADAHDDAATKLTCRGLQIDDPAA